MIHSLPGAPGSFRQGYLDAEERRRLQQAASELVEAPLYIDDTSGSNLIDLHAKLRRLTTERKVGLVVLDYLQLMSGRGRFESRVQEISALSRGLKLLAKELAVPVLVLSQLSRAPDMRPGDHRPQLVLRAFRGAARPAGLRQEVPGLRRHGWSAPR